MGLKEILSNIFSAKTDSQKKTIQVSGTYYVPAEVSTELQSMAMYICKDYIASAVAKCEVRTFRNGREIFEDEYYRWNIAPNPNQTSTEFWRELIFKLYGEGEALIVPIGPHMFIADGFSREQYAIRPDEYTGITRGTFTLDYKLYSHQVIHLTLPEEMTPSVLTGNIARLLNATLAEAVEKYSLEGGERGVLKIDATRLGDEEYDAAVQDLLDKDFYNYFNSRNAVVPMYNGTEYEQKVNNSGQKTSIVSDIQTLLNEFIKICAEAVKIPPVLVQGDIADTKTAVSNLLTFCIDPLLDMTMEAANKTLYGKAVLNGSYMQADTSCIEHMDVFSMAANIDKIKAASLLNTNEIRRKINEPRINEPWADEYTRTKNYETVGKVGKENAEE